MAVHHLVVDADASIGQVHAQLIAELSGDDHRLGNDFTRKRVDFTGVDDLVVHRHDGAANEVEAVCVVGHRKSEMVVSWNLRTRVPCSLDAKVADVKRLTAFIGQRLLESQNHVHWTKSIRQEGFGVGSQQGRVEWRNIGLQTSNGFLDLQTITVDVSVGDVVAVAVIEAEVGTIRFNFWKRNHTGIRRQCSHDLSVQRALEVRAFEDDINQAAIRRFGT